MKQTHKKTVRDPILRNVQQLEETINKMHKKNLSKYERIIKNSPVFEFKIFNPSIPQYSSREQIGFTQQIMLRQIDKLMDQQQKLNMELDKLQVKQQDAQMEKQIQTRNNMDHFTFLRKSWNKSDQCYSSQQQIQKLLHNVGSIKGHIKSMIKKQNNVHSHPQLKELIMESPQFKKLQQQKQLLQQQNKELKQKIQLNNIESLRKQMKLMQEQIHQLRTQNQNLQKDSNQTCTSKSTDSDREKAQCTVKIKSATNDYVMQIKSKELAESQEFFSSLNTAQVINYLKSGGRRGSNLRNDNQQKIPGGTVQFRVEDIACSKFISTKTRQ